jgi:hypothetical protein
LVQVTAASTTLTASSLATYCPDPSGNIDPLRFTVETALTGVGRFERGFLWASVSPNGVNYHDFYVIGASEQIFLLARGTTTPVSVLTFPDTSCTSGERVEARVQAQFEHLGRTEILISHCAP